MSRDLGWRADGIERARACGGIELQVYRRPGFGAGLAIRRVLEPNGGAGVETEWMDADPVPDELRGGEDPPS